MPKRQDRPTRAYGSPASVSDEEQGPAPALSWQEGDVVRHVGDALARFGSGGQLTFSEGVLSLQGPSFRSSAQLGCSLETWAERDFATKQRLASDLARELAAPRSLSHRPSRKIYLPVSPLQLLVAGCVVGVLAYIWFFDLSSSPRSQNKDLSHEASLGEREPRVTREDATTGRSLSVVRASNSCRTSLSRMLTGGTISVAEAEGWVVELALLRQGAVERLATHPALRRYVADPRAPLGSKFIDRSFGALGTVDTSDTVVQVRQADVVGAEGVRASGVRLTFGGTYVDSYFSKEKRATYFAIAHKLSQQLKASHSALYARCADGEQPSLGSWFRGIDAASASAALLYFIGTYSRPPHIASPFYKRPDQTALDPGVAFESISAATTHIDRPALATLVGSEGGMATGKSGDAVTITFPFADGNRASRVSRTLARAVRLQR